MSWGIEDRLQVQVMDFLRVAAPDLIVFAVPNGGSRHPAEAAKLKAMGVRPGVPDLVFVLPTGKVAFIELKAPKGRLTPHQIAFAGDCDEQGIPHLVCRSLAEVQGALAAWGIPTKARAAA